MTPTRGTVDLQSAGTDRMLIGVRCEIPTMYFQIVEVRTTGIQRSQENKWPSALNTDEVQILPMTNKTVRISSTAVCVLQ